MNLKSCKVNKFLKMTIAIRFNLLQVYLSLLAVLASHADVVRGSSRVPAPRTPKNVCVGGYCRPCKSVLAFVFAVTFILCFNFFEVLF